MLLRMLMLHMGIPVMIPFVVTTVPVVVVGPTTVVPPPIAAITPMLIASTMGLLGGPTTPGSSWRRFRDALHVWLGLGNVS